MKKIYVLLYPHVRTHWPLLLGSVLFSFVLAGIKTTHAYLIKPVIDHGVQPNTAFDEIFFIAGMVMGLALINFPARFFHFYWIRYVVEKATCEIRTKIYHKLQKLPLNYFQKNRQGELLSSLLNDTLVLSHGLQAMVDLIREPLTAIALFSLALYRDWQLTLVVVAVIPLFIIVFQKYGKKVRNCQAKAQDCIAEMTHNMSEGLQGQKVIKAFNIQDYVIERFEQTQRFFFRFVMKTTKNEEFSHPLVEFVGGLAFSGVLLFASYRISLGVMSPGDFISFAVALALLMDPIRKYSQANMRFNQARAAGERILNILNLEVEEDHGTLEKLTFDDKIELKNITFSYGDADILKDFSLQIKKGEKVALVGLSGSGKSTLINLFLRLYDIQKGKVLIDGIPIEQLTLVSLRSLFGLVSQDTFLFNDSIKENLCLGKEYNEEKLQEALQVSHSSEFIAQLPRKMETVIGDRGTRLSGGQAQRVTIARAYLKQNPVLLFDEATSALDNESEKIVQKALDEFSAGHTVIAVAHRLSTIQHFDKIVVLKEGIKVEQGPHQELLERKGEYSKLHELSH